MSSFSLDLVLPAPVCPIRTTFLIFRNEVKNFAENHKTKQIPKCNAENNVVQIFLQILGNSKSVTLSSETE